MKRLSTLGNAWLTEAVVADGASARFGWVVLWFDNPGYYITKLGEINRETLVPAKFLRANGVDVPAWDDSVDTTIGKVLAAN